MPLLALAAGQILVWLLCRKEVEWSDQVTRLIVIMMQIQYIYIYMSTSNYNVIKMWLIHGLLKGSSQDAV